MPKIALDEFYYGDRYNVYGNALAEFISQDKSTNKTLTSEEITNISILISKHTVKQTINLIKNGDFISELETEMKSLSLCLEENFYE
ncbi:MAG: hypothetical protein R3Y12_01795 [Clostridia bacterium]